MEVKSFSEFSYSRTGFANRKSMCKNCMYEHRREYMKNYKKKKLKTFVEVTSGVKTCTHCKVEKPVTEFRKLVTVKDGRQSWCIRCTQKQSHERDKRLNFPPRKEGVKKCSRCEQVKSVREFSPHKYHRDGLASCCKKCDGQRSVCRNRRDPQSRLASTLRSRLLVALQYRDGTGYKGGSAVADLGCTIPELKKYLEDQFYPHPHTGELMNWDNWSNSGWQIDHIKPLSSFDLLDRAQFLEASRYTNLRPLWLVDHIRKTKREQKALKLSEEKKS